MIDIVAHRFDVSFRQIPVQFSQMKERERHANDIDDNPENVEYIVTKRAMYQWATRRIVPAFRVGR